jgi:PAT family beta-lactamase induction signal transducer AmpG
MLITLMMGFSSGLPLLLTLSLLQVWLRSSGVDLTTIGLFALVGLPYTLKFLWAPLLDRYSPWPLGRRRGWLLWTQSTLMVAIALLGNMDPQDNLTALALVALDSEIARISLYQQQR